MIEHPKRVEYLAQLAKYGIDEDDPKYHRLELPRSNEPICDWCHRHAASHPRARCDLQQAIAEEMRAAGDTVECCVFCLDAYRVVGADRLCSKCRERQERDLDRSRDRRRSSTAVYRADGHGCVERVHPTELALEAREGGADRGWE